MRRTKTRVWRGFLVAAAALAVGGCGTKEQAAPASEKVPVVTVEVGTSSVAPTLEYTGTVRPWRKVLLGAQIQGRVERFYVNVGDRVTKGDLLAELAGEQLAEAKARFDAVEADYERMRALREQGAITEQAFEQMQATYDAARAGYDLVLGSAQLRAPFTGVVSERFLEEGEVYTLVSMTTPTPAVLEIVRMDSVKIEIRVAEREKQSVVPGLAARVAARTLRGGALAGRIITVEPGLDPMSNTAAAEVAAANPGEVLKPGMLVDVEVQLPAREALLIPRDALVRQEGTAVFYVYAVDGGAARRRELTLGDGFGDEVEVLEGLADGETIVTSGRYRLHDGSEVETVSPPEAGAAEEEGAR